MTGFHGLRLRAFMPEKFRFLKCGPILDKLGLRQARSLASSGFDDFGPAELAELEAREHQERFRSKSRLSSFRCGPTPVTTSEPSKNVAAHTDVKTTTI